MCWGENVGLINWSPSPAVGAGVTVHETFLAGRIWSENLGWITLGDGTPANGVSYANADGSDFGVNHDPNTGYLSGLAWSENAGWINFSGGAMAQPEQPARIAVDPPRRFYGYAWGENVGWISMEGTEHFVQIEEPCDPDLNQDGNADQDDVAYLINVIAGGENPTGIDPDFNGDGNVDQDDVAALINVVAGGGCP
jgi:hypothetical protein